MSTIEGSSGRTSRIPAVAVRIAGPYDMLGRRRYEHMCYVEWVVRCCGCRVSEILANGKSEAGITMCKRTEDWFWVGRYKGVLLSDERAASH